MDFVNSSVNKRIMNCIKNSSPVFLLVLIKFQKYGTQDLLTKVDLQKAKFLIYCFLYYYTHMYKNILNNFLK
jgi:hypothetical protein